MFWRTRVYVHAQARAYTRHVQGATSISARATETRPRNRQQVFDEQAKIAGVVAETVGLEALEVGAQASASPLRL